ncbi:extracellular solute-binding protein [Bifidobacterium goeldii]|uniref:Extracellular solute-binding protein n=1 Tax=Bifidobacterium goeldii TaxID=2306975 RepID=A0A430FLI1_9BIFI|nr:sugar ABC transporter substrate-binding protein [Bifidobacterium goeldii]RSX53601.1 extracellular solute-binding protein [Bifidobacterium goeldii]
MRFAAHRITRVLAASGVVAALVMTSACGTGSSTGGSSTSDSGGKVELTFSGWVPNIEKAVDLWNQKNPNIQVKFTRVASDAQLNFGTQIDAGSAPDIIQMDQYKFPNLVIDQQVQDISQYVKDTKSDFIDSAWNVVTYGGNQYAVPQDSGPVAMMYRKDLFEQYGIEVPKTWDEYVAAAKKLHEANPDVYIAQFSPNEEEMFVQDIYQAGGSYLDSDGEKWKVTINDKKTTAKVAERWQELFDGGLLKTEQMWTPEYWSDVNAGKIATIIRASWFPVLLQENAPDLSGKWAVAPTPSDSGDGPYANTGGSVDAVTTLCKHPAEAAKFITWLNSDPESLKILISEGGLFPAAKAGYDLDELNQASDYFGGQKVNDVYIAAAKNVISKGKMGPELATASTSMRDELTKVSNGEQTFAQALDNDAAILKKAIKSKGLEVE